MRRLLVLAMALTTTLTAVGCTDSTGPAGSLAGTYSLRTLNGVQVPVTVIATGTGNSAYTLEVLAGSIVLDEQGNYTGTIRYRETVGFQQPAQYDDTIIGYWTLSGSQLTLTDSQTGDQYYATASGGTLTLTDGTGYTEVYTK